MSLIYKGLNIALIFMQHPHGFFFDLSHVAGVFHSPCHEHRNLWHLFQFTISSTLRDAALQYRFFLLAEWVWLTFFCLRPLAQAADVLALAATDWQLIYLFVIVAWMLVRREESFIEHQLKYRNKVFKHYSITSALISMTWLDSSHREWTGHCCS